MLYLFVEVFLVVHAEMMIVLLATGDLCNFMKAQIVRVRFIKGEYDIDKITAQPDDIGNAGFSCKGDHAFGGMNSHFAKLLVASGKMPEQ